jgi:hypothetical protein
MADDDGRWQDEAEADCSGDELALGAEASTEVGVECQRCDDKTKTCNTCDNELPVTEFQGRETRKKGKLISTYIAASCRKCDATVESYQKRKKLEWGREYRVRWKALKENKPAFKASIKAARHANPDACRGRVRIQAKDHFLKQEKTSGVTSIDRARFIPLTYPAWEERALKVKHGGFSPAQAAAKWKEWQSNSSIDRDKLGFVSGEAGFERLFCPILDEKLIDQFRGKRSAEVTETRRLKRHKKADTENFLDGKATLSEEEEACGLSSGEDQLMPLRRSGSPTPTSSMSHSAPRSVSTTSTPLLPPAPYVAKPRPKIIKRFEKAVATAEGLKMMEAILLDAATVHAAAIASYQQTRKDIFGEPEDVTVLEQWLPYETMICRKAKWALLVHGPAMVLEAARMEAIAGSAAEAEGPVKGWMHVVCLEGMRDAAESGIVAALNDDDVKLVATKLKGELKLFKGVHTDLASSIKRLRSAAAPAKDKKPKAKAQPKAQASGLVVAPAGLAKRPRKMPSLLQTQLPFESEMLRYTVHNESKIKEIVDCKIDGFPVAVNAAISVDKLMRDPSFVPPFHAFKRDFDTERTIATAGQGTRKFRAMVGDSVGCEAAAKAMEAFVPEWALEVTDAELQQHSPAAVLMSASSTMSRKGLSFFGMAKEDFAVGRDWLGFPTIRMHFHGFRVVMAWKTQEVLNFKRELDKVTGIEFEPNEKFNFKELDDFLEEVSGDRIKELLLLPSFSHGTFGAGSMLLVPPGFTIMEKTLGLTSFGIKRSLFPNEQSTITSMRDELSKLVSPPRGGLSSLTIAEAVCAARLGVAAAPSVEHTGLGAAAASSAEPTEAAAPAAETVEAAETAEPTDAAAAAAAVSDESEAEGVN